MCIVLVAGLFISFLGGNDPAVHVHSWNCFPEYYDVFEKIF